MDACEGSVIGGGISAFVRATPLLDTLIEQLVREQPAWLANPLFSLSSCSGATQQRHPEGA
jgi:hypothetical protein